VPIAGALLLLPPRLPQQVHCGRSVLPSQFRQTVPLPHRFHRTFRHKLRSEHRGSDGATDQPVEPVIVWPLDTLLPFLDSAPAAGGRHGILGSQLLGQEPMAIGLLTKKRKTPFITHRDLEPTMDEGLPEVGIEHDVPQGSLSCRAGNPPVVSNLVAG
jgi:hypothetical protein